MANKDLEDPVSFTPDKKLGPEPELPADPPKKAVKVPRAAKGGAVSLEGTLVSGTVDDDGKLTVNMSDGSERKAAPGEFEALGNDRVKFKK